MGSPVSITRETEFYQGYIWFKVSVSNESPYVINDVTLDLIFDENLLYIAGYDDFTFKNGKFLLGNISGNGSKTLTLLFEPLTCIKAADIKCQVCYTDHEGNMSPVFMEPVEISVVCPIMETDQNINIVRLKGFIVDLPARGSRACEVQSGFDVKELTDFAREAVEKHDVRHICTLQTYDGRTCETWYYGRAKGTKHDIAISISVHSENHTMEIFAATRSAGALTGILAEVGRDLKKIIEDRASGRDMAVNVHIKDPPVRHSNLLDMCNMDGTCDGNVAIEDQHASIAYADEEARTGLGKEGQGREDSLWRVREDPEKLQKADFTNSIGMQFMTIPAGELMMGSNKYDSEKPVHKVTIPGPFQLGKYPVTQKEWKAVMGRNPSYFKGDDRPVESVSWNDAQEFVKKLNAKEGTDKYRLPSEAEWEYACRSGKTTKHSIGEASSKLDEFAWYSGYDTYKEWDKNKDHVLRNSTQVVGQKKPNPWGICDMHGNVWEWVQDNWHDTYENAPKDGSAWENHVSSKSKKKGLLSRLFCSGEKKADLSSYRVLRGGSCYCARLCRSADRLYSHPHHRNYYLGFRILREI